MTFLSDDQFDAAYDRLQSSQQDQTVKPPSTPVTTTDTTPEVSDDDFEKAYKAYTSSDPRDMINYEVERYNSDSSNKHKLDPDFAWRIADRESNHFSPSVMAGRQLSPKGAIGMMQLMPETATSLGVNNPADPTENLRGGIKYLGQMLNTYNGDQRLAAAAYNAGPGAVNDYLYGTNTTRKNPRLLKTDGIPDFEETRNYVDAVSPVEKEQPFQPMSDEDFEKAYQQVTQQQQQPTTPTPTPAVTPGQRIDLGTKTTPAQFIVGASTAKDTDVYQVGDQAQRVRMTVPYRTPDEFRPNLYGNLHLGNVAAALKERNIDLISFQNDATGQPMTDEEVLKGGRLFRTASGMTKEELDKFGAQDRYQVEVGISPYVERLGKLFINAYQQGITSGLSDKDAKDRATGVYLDAKGKLDEIAKQPKITGAQYKQQADEILAKAISAQPFPERTVLQAAQKVAPDLVRETAGAGLAGLASAAGTGLEFHEGLGLNFDSISDVNPWHAPHLGGGKADQAIALFNNVTQSPEFQQYARRSTTYQNVVAAMPSLALDLPRLAALSAIAGPAAFNIDAFLHNLHKPLSEQGEAQVKAAFYAMIPMFRVPGAGTLTQKGLQLAYEGGTFAGVSGLEGVQAGQRPSQIYGSMATMGLLPLVMGAMHGVEASPESQTRMLDFLQDQKRSQNFQNALLQHTQNPTEGTTAVLRAGLAAQGMSDDQITQFVNNLGKGPVNQPRPQSGAGIGPTAPLGELPAQIQPPPTKFTHTDEGVRSAVDTFNQAPTDRAAENAFKPKGEGYDQENVPGVSGQVGVGQEPEQTKPVEGAGREAAGAGRILQKPEERKVEDDGIRLLRAINQPRSEARRLYNQIPTAESPRDAFNTFDRYARQQLGISSNVLDAYRSDFERRFGGRDTGPTQVRQDTEKPDLQSNDVERVRGGADVGQTARGTREVDKTAKDNVDQFHRIVVTDALRGQQAGKQMQETNPFADVVTNPNVRTQEPGEVEGEPVSKRRDQYYKDHPDERPPGNSRYTGRGAETNNEFKSRVHNAVGSEVDRSNQNPDERTVIVTHDKVIKSIPGPNADTGGLVKVQRNSSGNLFTKKVERKPGQVFLDPGVYMMRHGETPWNGPSEGGPSEPAIDQTAPGIFRQPGSDKGRIIHLSTKGKPGDVQVTDFDSRGFSGDRQFDSFEKAHRERALDGYTESMPSADLDKLAATDKFAAGSELTTLINKKGETPEEQKAIENRIRELADIYHGKPKQPPPPTPVETTDAATEKPSEKPTGFTHTEEGLQGALDSIRQLSQPSTEGAPGEKPKTTRTRRSAKITADPATERAKTDNEQPGSRLDAAVQRIISGNNGKGDISEDALREFRSAAGPAGAKLDPDYIASIERSLIETNIRRRTESPAASDRRATAAGTTDTGNLAPRPPATEPAYGNQTVVKIPGTNEQIPGRWSVRERGDVQASHNPQTFEPNPDFELKNDRQYNKQIGYQADVIANSSQQNFDPQRVINNNPTAENGAPIIDKRGNVLGGNSRVMMIVRNYTYGDAYKQELVRQASQFGLNPEQIAGMKDPILVREVSGDLDRRQAQDLITKFNITGTRAMTVEERAAAGASKIPQATADFISDKFRNAEEDATLNNVLDEHGPEIVNRLINDGILQPQDRNALFLRNGKLTTEAKLRLSQLFTARVFRDVDQYETVPDFVRANVERIAAPMMKVEGDPQWDITEETRNAMDALIEAKAHGMKGPKAYSNLSKYQEALGDFLSRQMGLFSETRPTDREIAIAKKIGGGARSAAAAFNTFADDAADSRRGGLLFDTPDPTESFNRAFDLEGGPPKPQPAEVPAPPEFEKTATTTPGKRVSDQTKYHVDEIPKADYLDDESRAIETRFRNYLVNNFEKAFADYREHFGKEINTDNVRELSTDYTGGEPPKSTSEKAKEARSKYSPAVHEPSSWFAKEIYRRMLQEPLGPDQDPVVLFTAGGTGAGKTSTLATSERFKNAQARAQIIMDGNLNNADKAIKKIDQALAAGKRVQITAVYRDPFESWSEGALPRGERNGRPVPPSVHVETHSAMRDSMEALSKYYRGNDNVEIGFIDNTHGKDNARDATIDVFKRMSDTEIRDLRPKLIDEAQKQYDAGKISKRTYDGSTVSHGPGEGATEGEAGTGADRLRSGTDQGGEGSVAGQAGGGEPEPDGAGRGGGESPEASEVTKPEQPPTGGAGELPPGKRQYRFTDEGLQKAKDAWDPANIKKQRFGGPLSDEQLKAALYIAGYHVERGAYAFADFSKKMIEHVGERVRPYLQDLHQRALAAVGRTPEETTQQTASEPEQPNLPGQPEQPQKATTGIKHAVVDLERELRDAPPIPPAEHRSTMESLRKGKAAVDNHSIDPDVLAKNVNKNNRPLSDEEQGALLYGRMQLYNEHRSIMDTIAKAAVDNDEGTIMDQRARLAVVEEKINDNDLAARAAGTQLGRGLAFRRAMIDSDYSLAGALQRMRVANNGKEISDSARDRITTLTKQLDEAKAQAEKDIAARDEKISRLESDRAVKLEQRKAAFEGRQQTRKATKARLDTEWEGQKARLLKLLAGRNEPPNTPLGGGYSSERGAVDIGPLADIPEAVSLMKDMVRNRVEAGMTNASEIIDSIHDSFKDQIAGISKRHVRDATSGYGKTSNLSKDEIDVALREINRQNRLISGIQDAEQGQAPARSGLQRDKVTPEVRDLKRQLAQTMRENGVNIEKVQRDAEEQQKSHLDARKTSLRNEIDDLDREAAGIRAPDKERLKTQYDDETIALTAERDMLKRRATDPTEKNRTQVQAQLKEVDRRLAEKDFSRQEAKYPATVYDDPETTAMRKELADKNRQLDQQRKLPETIKNLETKIADVKNKIANKDYTKTPGQKVTPRPVPDEVADLQGQLKDLNKQLSDARRESKTAGNLENRITDLQRRIREKDFSKVDKGTTKEVSDRIADLRQKRDALNKEYQALRPNSPLTDEQRLDAAKKSAQRSYEDYQRRIDQHDFSVKNKQPQNVLTDEELKQIQKKRDTAKQQYQQLRDSDPLRAQGPALQAYKTRLANREADLKNMLATGNYAKAPKRTLILDAAAQSSQARVAALKEQVDMEVRKQQLASRSNWEKAGDAIVKWRRAILLSNPVTIAKLGGAAVFRQVTTPIKEAIGGGLSLLPGVSRIAAKAPREGGFSLRAEMQAVAENFTKQTLEDTKLAAKTGKTSLDLLYGKRGALPPEASDFFGHLHAAMKTSTKRAEFTRSMAKRLEFASRNGQDVSDPTVQATAAAGAYLDANRSIFMQDNALTSGFESMLGRMSQASAGGKAGAMAIRTLLPIVKVPTNFAFESMDVAFGGLKAGAILLRRGVEGLSPEEADSVMRSLKNQGLGAALMATGYFAAHALGGFYQEGEKRRPGALKPGEANIGFMTVPHQVLHAPAMEALQMGAQFRRVIDRYNGFTPESMATGAFSATTGPIKTTPFLEEAGRISKAMKDYPSASTFFGELGKSALPPILQQGAEYLDKDSEGQPIKRYPSGILDNLRMGIPWVRQGVSQAKQPKAVRRAALNY